MTGPGLDKDLGEIDLIRSAQAGNKEAMDALLAAYKGLARSKAQKTYLPGADQEDLIQEAMIGLFKAVNQFDPDREVPFRAFAGHCIDMQLIDAIRGAGRLKHKLLNDSLSLDKNLTEMDDANDLALVDTLEASQLVWPDEVLANREQIKEIFNFIDRELSPREQSVLLASMTGLSYREIADNLGISFKSVDGALQRARKKLQNFIS